MSPRVVLHTSRLRLFLVFFFFNDTATTEIYTLSLHDALPICRRRAAGPRQRDAAGAPHGVGRSRAGAGRALHGGRSEEHTSELQSLAYLVCRLLLEKKNEQTVRRPVTRRRRVDQRGARTGQRI